MRVAPKRGVPRAHVWSGGVIGNGAGASGGERSQSRPAKPKKSGATAGCGMAMKEGTDSARERGQKEEGKGEECYRGDKNEKDDLDSMIGQAWIGI